jgi:hypothetical protein
MSYAPLITVKEDAAKTLAAGFGFRSGDRGTMTSRTIMLAELSAVLDPGLTLDSKVERWTAIVDENLLGKKTASTRKLTAQRLTELYALDESVTLFRLLRFFWQADSVARPLLAMLCACGRDPLLRLTSVPVLQAKLGEVVSTGQIEASLSYQTGERFNPETANKIARNASSSWQQSGHLKGRTVKTRSRPNVTPANVAYALALGYLEGARGISLLRTFWSSLLDVPEHVINEAAREAAARGWLNYRGIGGIIEIDFSPLLTKREVESLA